MPHDMKGRKIEKGDYVKAQAYLGRVVGQVSAVTESSNTCNVGLAVIVPGKVEIWTVTAKECELVMKADGSDPGDPAPVTPVSPGPEAHGDGGPA